jgi:hypothetical protein
MQGSRSGYSRANMADFGMALPYFVEIVDLKEVRVSCGPRVAHSEIGQVFGEQTVIVRGVTRDGQAWQAIYPHETSDCWVIATP